MKQDRVFQNLFELAHEPLFVQLPTVQQEHQDASQNLKSSSKQKTNTFISIFSALTNAQANGIIKISEGLYNQTNEICTPGIKMHSTEPSMNVVIANEMYPSLIINLPSPQDKIWIQNIKFAHLCEHEKGLIAWPNLRQMHDNRYLGLATGENMNACIVVRRGVLCVEECRFSLAGQRDGGKIYPCIVVEQEGSLVMTRSQIVGGVSSVGVYCSGGKVKMQECLIKDHGGVGMLICGNTGTSLLLRNSVVSGCSQGIVLNGPFCSTVQSNIISDCERSGITMLFGNTSNIINNQIKTCLNGLQVTNSCPKIMKNNFVKNQQFGVCSYSRMNGQCRPLMRFNVIQDNRKGGMLVYGSRNRSEVCNNVIRLNRNVGIKVDCSAHPHIFLNQISKTFGNGVYVCGGGNSFLEKNDISGSLNCNLVLQGPRNIDSYVYNNQITNARGIGIFLQHCQKFLVAKNTISGNYTGLLAVTSVVHVEDNKIRQNKCNGVMMVDDCHLLLSQNQIEGNAVCGLVCRGTSQATIRRNSFKDNSIEMVAENSWEGVGEVQKENQFQEGADIRIPGNLACNLI